MNEELLIVAKPSRRIGAFIIDTLINLLIDIVLLVPSILALANVAHHRLDADIAPAIIALFVSSLVSGSLFISFAIFYFVCLPVLWEGQTIGKRLFKIRVVDMDTNEGPSAKVMFLREATRILIFVLSFGLSLIASGIALCVGEKHVTFHEQISHTKVVNINMYKELN